MTPPKPVPREPVATTNFASCFIPPPTESGLHERGAGPAPGRTRTERRGFADRAMMRVARRPARADRGGGNYQRRKAMSSGFFGAIPVLCCAVAVALSQQAAAQDAYPTKPGRVIAPFPPGGSTHVLCRVSS